MPLFNEIINLDIQTAKIFGIEDIIVLSSPTATEINPYGKRYIHEIGLSKIESICKEESLNLIYLETSNIKTNEKSINSYHVFVENLFLSLYRSDKYNNHPKVRKQINNISLSCSQLEKSFNELIIARKYHTVYFFNNRFPTAKAVSISCIFNHINFITYDTVARARLHYSKNKAVLSSESLKESIENELSKVSHKELADFASKFIEYKRSKKFIAYELFNKRQIRSKLPEALSKNYICVLTNSYDEQKVWAKSIGINLIDPLEMISDIINLSKANSIQVVVRIHPNQSKSFEENYLLNRYINKKENVIILSGDSLFDTYALMQNSIANITFGSSTGVESILLGKRSYLIGNAFYQDTVCIPRFNTAEECMKKVLIDNKTSTNMISREKYNASKWFAYLSGEFADDRYKLVNILKNNPSTSLGHKLLKLIWRIDRLSSYPIEFNLRRAYVLLSAQINNILR
ncbi:MULTISPECIES: hypothetical protein [unclassified Prochlorococcus]|uniref:hypothetical protein n=1 Tax=unclassified Prochlorococcus TaxID=2627481 RepID=UPI0012683644|nr:MULTISPECIES: hypothetical protein [unclassified Prochlorococcus]